MVKVTEELENNESLLKVNRESDDFELVVTEVEIKKYVEDT